MHCLYIFACGERAQWASCSDMMLDICSVGKFVWCMNVWVGVAAVCSFVCCLTCPLLFSNITSGCSTDPDPDPDPDPHPVELETIHGASASAEGYRPLRANV